MSKSRVLIVEDQAIVALDIRVTVINMGYDVVGIADSGQEAARLAWELRPDLILMDIQIKGTMDGLEAGRLIRESVGSAIVYVSASPDTGQIPHFVQKPFSAATLASAMCGALEAQ